MSALADSFAGLEQEEDSFVPRTHIKPLQKSGPPLREIQNEKAWHRTAAYLVAKGLSQTEVSQAVGKSQETISLLARQRFFTQLVAEIIADFSLIDEGAINVLRQASSAAAHTIVKLADSAKSEAVQLAASQSLLDRVFGKAVATVHKTSGSVALDPGAELKELSTEIERLQKRVGISVETVGLGPRN